jgi:predicted MFS family arabinose efflux permease
MRHVQLTGLWRHPDFLKLWVGQTISLFGSQVTSLALPLTAVLVLHATPAQMGFLAAAVYAPGLLVSLFAGVWVDRVRRRPLLIGADVGRALLLALIPVAALLHLIRIEQLYAVGFSVGVLTTLFTVAYQSFLPAVVSTDRLADANSKLTASASLAQIAGPALAGALVQLVTAPLAILVDALSFLASALFLARMRITDEGPGRQGPRKDIWREMGDGLRLTFGQPLLGTFAVSAGTNNLFGTLFSAVLVLYVTRRLGIGPAVLGVIFASAGPGGLLGTLLAPRVARWVGSGPAILAAQLLLGLSVLLVPLAGGPSVVVPALLGLSQFALGFALPILNVNLMSLVQATTPQRTLGRVSASIHVVTSGTMPLGALLGGALGSTAGLRITLLIGAAGTLLPLLPMTFSPLRTLRVPPAAVANPASSG